MSQPLDLILELARASSAADADRPAAGEWNRYLLRWPDDSGRYEEGEIVWNAASDSALVAVGDAATAQAAIDALAASLHALMDAAGWAKLVARIAAARSRGRRVAITLRPAAHELYALPWELLDIGGSPLYTTDDCWLRYTIAGEPPRPATPPPSSRILVVAAAAGAVPIRDHVAAIAAAARAGCVPFDPERDVLANATKGDLERALAGGGVTVLHLLCHGVLRSDSGAFGLALDPDRGPTAPAEMAELLAPHAGTLRLVVLAACLGASPPGIDHALDNIAQAIHARGIASVIASRYLLTVPGSTELSRALYHELLVRKASLSAAFVASRAALRLRPRTPDEAPDVDGLAVQLHGGEFPSLEFRPWIFRPYRGLSPYERDDSSFFFGRDGDRATLLQLLAAALASGGPRFALVAGASGTGKSSLVRAGLVNDLEAGKLPSPPSWSSAIVRPGEGGVDRLRHVAADMLPKGPYRALVVDQLEEIFTEIDRDDDREAFLRELWRIATEPDAQVFVIATIRIEYLGRLGSMRMADGTPFDRVMLAAGHIHLLQQLGLDDYATIIQAPADLVGIRLEQGLRERLLADLRAEPGTLPLLSFALERLWQERSFQTFDVQIADGASESVRVTGWWLTQAAYDAMNGVGGSLARSADQLLARLTQAETDELRRVLVQLVHGNDDPLLITRRRGWRDAMRPDPMTEPEAARCYDRVLDAWIDERLLVTGAAAPGAPVWIELAHDALIGHWPVLRGWYADARKWLQDADALLPAAAEWRAHANDDAPSYLLRGQRLSYHLEAWQRYRAYLGGRDRDLAQAFLDACQQADEEARKQEIEQQRRDAVAQERAIAAHDAALMYNALQLRDAGQPAWATKLLAEVARPLLTPGWLAFAAELLATTTLVRTLDGGGQSLDGVTFSPDGTLALTFGGDNNVRLWRADGDGDPLILHHDAGVNTARFSPDGALVLTGSDDGIARLWRVDGAAPPVQFQGADGPVNGVTFSADGQRFITMAKAGARIWRIADPQHSILLPHDQDAFDASFSPDSTRIVTRCLDGAARIWTPDGVACPPALRHAPDDIPHPVTSIQFTPDGRCVITSADKDRTVRIWSLDDLARPRVVDTRGDILALSADGELAACSNDSIVRIVRLADPEHRTRELPHRGWVGPAAFNRDGTRLATVSADLPSVRSPKKTIQVWNIVSGPPFPVQVLSGHDANVTRLAFSMDASQLGSASEDKTARIWRVEQDLSETQVIQIDESRSTIVSAKLRADGYVVAVYTAPAGSVGISPSGAPGGDLHIRHSGNSNLDVRIQLFDPRCFFAFSPDGKQAVMARSTSELCIWSLEAVDHNPAAVLSAQQNSISCVAFSRDSQQLIAGTSNGEVRVWSLADFREIAVLSGHVGTVLAVALTANGQLAATASNDGVIRIWQLPAACEIMAFQGIPARTWSRGPVIDSLMFSSDARHLLAGVWPDNTPRVWRLDITGRQSIPAAGSSSQAAFFDLQADVMPAAFSDDGKCVITTSGSDAQLWYLDEPGRFVRFQGHAKRINAVAISPDSELVATTSEDETVRVWRSADPRQFMILRHRRAVAGVQFSADSTRVLTRTTRRASLWAVDLPTILTRLGNATADCLPPALHERYLGETPEASRKRYEQCECSHHRTPGAS